MRPLEQLLPSGETTVVDLRADQDTPDEWMERKDVIQAVRNAIESLPLHFRLPLVLKEIEDLSVDEVANILGIKPATVKTRLHRARLAVRQELSKPLPQRELDDAAASEGACLDLLWAKQEALDRGADFPIPEQHMCERCRSVFATLDLAEDVCRLLGEVELPEAARRRLEERVMQARG
jgi:RNA polymerase sigma-70 factor (ECF subfamily)